MANRTVAVVLRADTGQFQAGLLKASSQVRMLGTDTAAASANADKGFRQAAGGASMFGTALKTAAAAGAGLAAANFLKNSIGAASDLNETLNKSNVIFGENAQKVEKWSQSSAKSFGLSKSAALEAASGFGNMLQQLGFTGDAAVDASTGVVKLAADLGSFNNLETDDVLDRIGAAMRGEYDSLQLLIPNINAARVEQEAMAETGKANAKELTAQEKAAAVLAIVHKDGAAAADDFAETSDGLANATKIAKAQFADLQAEIGQRFLPIAEDAMGFMASTAIPALGGVADGVFDLVNGFRDLPAEVQVGIAAFGLWAVAGDRVMDGFRSISGAMSPLRDSMSAFGEALDYARANGDGLGTVLRDVGSYAGGQALTGLKALGRAIGPELAVAAGAATLFGFIDGLKSMTQASDEAKAAAEGLAKALTLTDQAADRRAIRSAIEDVDGLVEVLDQAGVSSSDAINGLLGQADAQRRVLAALREYRAEAYTPTGAGGTRESQDAREAVLAYEELATGYGTAASNARYFGQQASAAATATSQSGSAATGAATPMEMYAASLEFAAAAADQAKKQTDQFKMSLDILTGAHVSLIEVESAYQAALAEAKGATEGMTGAVLNGAGGLNLQSEAGRAASDVLLGVRDSGNQLIAQMIQQGATTDQVLLKDMALREDFIRTAGQMGINRQAAENLANQILGIPEKRNTTITADTEQARHAVENLQRQIDGLRGRTVDIIARASMPDEPGVRRFGAASGAVLPGWSPGRDVHHFVSPTGGRLDLSGGEAVMRPEFTRAVGSGWVHSMNAAARAGGVGGVRRALSGQAFAEGGIAGPISIAAHLNASAYNAEMDALSKKVLDRAAGSLGSGAVGGGWQSLWDFVKARVPQARINSTYRPGDPGYHGRGKAIDFGFGSGPGGAGNAGLALINRVLHDGVGRNLAELIYDGVGDDRPDLKNGKPLTYNAGTRAEHRNHVHAAVYDSGGPLYPGYTLAYNGTGQTEWVSREFSGGAGRGGGGAVSVAAPQVNVTFLVDGQEFRGMTRTEIEYALGGLADDLAARGVHA